MSDAPERLYFYDDWIEKNAKGRLLCGNNEYIRADLAKPKVKPLEWEVLRGDDSSVWAVVMGIVYKAGIDPSGQAYFDFHTNDCSESGLVCVSLEEAKAAAQADYERRIMECLICP